MFHFIGGSQSGQARDVGGECSLALTSLGGNLVLCKPAESMHARTCVYMCMCVFAHVCVYMCMCTSGCVLGREDRGGKSCPLCILADKGKGSNRDGKRPTCQPRQGEAAPSTATGSGLHLWQHARPSCSAPSRFCSPPAPRRRFPARLPG